MNITIASFVGCSRERITEPLYQYDYGQILKIEGLELPFSFQAHFCSLGDTQTITQVGTDNEVTIPDALLQKSLSILCYIYLHTGEDDGETEYKITIPVVARPKPSNATPTPVQQDEIDQLIIALNDGVSEAEGYAESAGQAKTDAENAVLQAEQAVLDAQGYASDAHTSELHAKASEDNADLSEANAKRSEDNSAASEANALLYSQNSANSALLSKSWAVGGTNTRLGEDTDNSKYYSEMAQQAANTAGYLDVYIENGHLIYLRTDQVDVDFSLQNGHLIMEAI